MIDMSNWTKYRVRTDGLDYILYGQRTIWSKLGLVAIIKQKREGRVYLFLFDQFGHHIGKIAINANILVQQPINQSLVAINSARDNHQEIIDPATNRPAGNKIGRASCRERVWITVGSGELQ